MTGRTVGAALPWAILALGVSLRWAILVLGVSLLRFAPEFAQFAYPNLVAVLDAPWPIKLRLTAIHSP